MAFNKEGFICDKKKEKGSQVWLPDFILFVSYCDVLFCAVQ